MSSNCLKREGAPGPVVQLKRKYASKKKSEAGEVAEVKSKRKKKVMQPVEGEVARRRYRCDHCSYSSNNQVSQVTNWPTSTCTNTLLTGCPEKAF